MSEPAPAGPPADPKATPLAVASIPEPPGDPADLGDADKKALDAERTARKAAEKSATDLQAQIDKINQANESAVEKATRESNEFKAAAEKATTEALRLRVATKHGISEEDADLFLTGSDMETVERQATALAARTANATTSAGPRPDLSQGTKGSPAGADDPATAFAHFIKQQTG